MLRMHLEGLLRLKAPALFNDISKAEALMNYISGKSLMKFKILLTLLMFNARQGSEEEALHVAKSV